MIKIIIALAATFGIYGLLKQAVIFVYATINSMDGSQTFLESWQQLQGWNPVWLLILIAIIFVWFLYHLMKAELPLRELLNFKPKNSLVVNIAFVFSILGGLYILSFGFGFLFGILFR